MAQPTHSRIGPLSILDANILRLSGADRLDDQTAGLAIIMDAQPINDEHATSNSRAVSKLRAPDKGSRCDNGVTTCRLEIRGANRQVDGRPLQ
jgi:hypothetical protein